MRVGLLGGDLWGEGEAGLFPLVDAAFQDVDVLEAEFMHKQGDVPGAGAEGAIDEAGAILGEVLESLSGLFKVEVVDVMGSGESFFGKFRFGAGVDEVDFGGVIFDELGGGKWGYGLAALWEGDFRWGDEDFWWLRVAGAEH